MLFDQFPQLPQLSCCVAHGRGKGNGAQPELGIVLCCFNVDMRRLIPFVTEKKEAMSADPQYRWHLLALTVEDVGVEKRGSLSVKFRGRFAMIQRQASCLCIRDDLVQPRWISLKRATRQLRDT